MFPSGKKSACFIHRDNLQSVVATTVSADRILVLPLHYKRVRSEQSSTEGTVRKRRRLCALIELVVLKRAQLHRRAEPRWSEETEIFLYHPYTEDLLQVLGLIQDLRIVATWSDQHFVGEY